MLLHNEGNYKQGEKTALRMEKIIANEKLTKNSSLEYTSSSCSSILEK